MIWLRVGFASLMERLGDTGLVLGILGRGLLVLAVCAALLSFLKRSNATWRHEVALAGMLLAALLPIVVVSGQGGAIFVPLRFGEGSLLSTLYEPSVPLAPSVPDAASRTALAEAAAATSSRARLEPPAWMPEGLPLAWLGGIAALLLVWTARRVAASVRLRPWRPVPAAWRDRLRALGASRAQAERLVLSDGAPVPLVWGALRPRIVLPPEASSWEEGRLDIAMRHELAHVHRRDSLTRSVVDLATLLHWPNPLAWLTRDRLVLERELACDRDVIAGGVPRSTYARELLDMVTAFRDRSRSQRWLAMAGPSHVRQRIREAIDGPGGAPPRLRATRILAAFALGALAVFVSSVHATPQAADGDPGRAASRRLEALGGHDLERLAAALRAGDLETLRAQGQLSVPRRAVAPLVDALGDADPGVRRVAAWALGETRSRRAGAALRNVLLDPDPGVRSVAAHALGDLGGARDVGALTTALGDPEPSVRREAAHALGDLRDPRAIDPLIERLDDAASAVADEADWALREILDTLDAYGLVLALNHPEARVRFHATHFLGDLADRDTVPPLLAILSDSDPGTRVEAAWALGEIADEAAVDALTALATDRSEPLDLREMAIRGLGEIRAARSGPELAELTTDPENRIRSQAADSLGALRDRAHHDLLRRLAAKDPDSEVRAVAAKAARRSR